MMNKIYANNMLITSPVKMFMVFRVIVTHSTKDIIQIYSFNSMHIITLS